MALLSSLADYYSDPSIKRTICKNCDTPFLPGVTCTHRMKGEHVFTLFIMLHFPRHMIILYMCMSHSPHDHPIHVYVTHHMQQEEQSTWP